MRKKDQEDRVAMKPTEVEILMTALECALRYAPKGQPETTLAEYVFKAFGGHEVGSGGTAVLRDWLARHGYMDPNPEGGWHAYLSRESVEAQVNQIHSAVKELTILLEDPILKQRESLRAFADHITAQLGRVESALNGSED